MNVESAGLFCASASASSTPDDRDLAARDLRHDAHEPARLGARRRGDEAEGVDALLGETLLDLVAGEGHEGEVRRR